METRDSRRYWILFPMWKGVLIALAAMLWQALPVGGQAEFVTIKSFYGVQNGVQKKEFTDWIPGDIRTSSWKGINFPGGESRLSVEMPKGIIGSVSKAGAFGGILRSNVLRVDHIAQFSGKAKIRVTVTTGIKDESGGIGLPYWEVKNVADLHGTQDLKTVKAYIPVKEAVFLFVTIPGMCELGGAIEAAVDKAGEFIMRITNLETKMKEALGMEEVYTTVFEKEMNFVRGGQYKIGGGHEIKVACSGIIAQSVEAVSIVTVEITEAGTREPSWVNIIDVKPNTIELAWEKCELADFSGYTVQYHEVVTAGKSWYWINHVTDDGYEVDKNRDRTHRIVKALKSATPYEFRVLLFFKSGDRVESKTVRATTLYAPLPDLVVTGISCDPPLPLPNQACKINITISNEGNAPTPKDYSCNGYVNGKPFLVTYYGKLEADKTYCASVSYTFKSADPQTIKVIVDEGNNVQERSEANNERTTVVKFYPDLRIKNLSFSLAAPEAN